MSAEPEHLRIERFKESTQAKLRDVRCPLHHRAPRLQFHGDSLREITVSLSGCCSRLMDLANARIALPPLQDEQLKKPA